MGNAKFCRQGTSFSGGDVSCEFCYYIYIYIYRTYIYTSSCISAYVLYAETRAKQIIVMLCVQYIQKNISKRMSHIL
jgi:hypothetical protein